MQTLSSEELLALQRRLARLLVEKSYPRGRFCAGIRPQKRLLF